MSSYYKRINGVNYDRAMIEAADKSVKGKGDGRISLDNAKTLVEKMEDGGKITDTELRTLNYILRNYKMTEPALKYIEDSLSDDLGSKDKDSSDHHSKVKHPQGEYQRPSEPKKKSKTNKIKYLIIFLCILILLIILLLANFVCEKDSSKDGTIPAQKNETMEAKTEIKTEVKTETQAETQTEIKTDIANDKNLKNDIISGENNSENNKDKYVIKKNDTLIKISQAIYGDYRLWKKIYNANRDKIKKPDLIYQGRILTIPEKDSQ